MKLSKTKRALYGNLRTVKMRRRHGLFTVEGSKAVADISRYFRIEALLLETGSEMPDIVLPSGVVIYEVTAQEMRTLSSFTTPSAVMGVFHIPEKSAPAVDPSSLYLMLDGVRDPGNLGTIIRTCHWFGIDRIFASYDTVDCYNPKTVQATMGSLGAVGVEYCDLEQVIDAHPDMNVYGTLLEGENVFNVCMEKKGFLVMGNEGTGISEGIRKRISRALNIPPATDNHGESLNVAVATAIVLAQIVR